ncbi:MAG TPA: DoxX family membrane protein [Candidatus Saccharimonadales bacterium]|nr:DoxX family membrane protein [Candidatus Saccharimonadales bacterium]
MKKILLGFFGLVYLLLPQVASAHEAYVLTRQEFDQGLLITAKNPFGPLIDPSHLGLFLFISVCVGLSFLLVLLWSTTSWARVLDKLIKKATLVGPLIIRLAISASFFYAAQSNSVLGPELTLAHLPGGQVVRFLLYLVAIMVFSGFFVELAGFIGLCIFVYMTRFYGLYMLTYLNYLGELLVLFLFGTRFVSFDRYLFGKKLWFQQIEKLRKYETPIIRVLYGLALIYAGWSIKFVHQNLSIEVYNQYHLQDFFRASAGFIAAGAGLSEILIGLFILIGFFMRWTILISLFFITISLLYFHELIWPHLMLYGISFSLLINSGDSLTIDHYMVPWARKLLGRLGSRR